MASEPNDNEDAGKLLRDIWIPFEWVPPPIKKKMTPPAGNPLFAPGGTEEKASINLILDASSCETAPRQPSVDIQDPDIDMSPPAVWGPFCSTWYFQQNTWRIQQAIEQGIHLTQLRASATTGLFTFPGLDDYSDAPDEFTVVGPTEPHHDYKVLWAEFLDEVADAAPSCWGPLPTLVAAWMSSTDATTEAGVKEIARASLLKFLIVIVPLHIAYAVAGKFSWLAGAHGQGKLTLDIIRSQLAELLSDHPDGAADAHSIASLLEPYPDKGKRELLSKVRRAYTTTIPRVFRALFAQDDAFTTSLASVLRGKYGEYAECDFMKLLVALPAKESAEPPAKRQRTTQSDATLLCLE